MRKKNPNSLLTVTCLPTYAVKCLIPALPDFQRTHPEIRVHLATSATFEEFEFNSYEVAIRYGSASWASVRSDRLHDKKSLSVCTQSVLEEARTLASTAEVLASFRQIRKYFHSMYQDDWPSSLEATVHKPVKFAGEAAFHLQLTSLATAVDGVGPAIGCTPLVNAVDTASCELVQPFDVRMSPNSEYFVSSPDEKAQLRSVELFRDWALSALGECVRRAAVAPSRAAHATAPAGQHTTCVAPATR